MKYIAVAFGIATGIFSLVVTIIQIKRGNRK